ncbi:MAG TPA: glycerophosphodiester phosphodiesterase [Acidimicrobiia bacterium]
MAEGADVEQVPVVLGHRGAPRAARENTLEAFRLATALGADGVELDARRSADGVVVVHHDAVAEGVGVLVEHAAAEIQARRPDIPTLDEALDACEGIVNVEVKNFPTEPDYDPDERVAADVVELVGRRAMRDRVIVSSFTTGPLDRVHAIDPSIATGWLTLPSFAVADAVPLAASRGYVAVHAERRAVVVDPVGVVAVAHDAGLRVHVWTVDDPDELRVLAAAGVDAVITNVPDVARRALRPPAPRS